MKRKINKGFTLVELLATIFIISIVLGIGGYLIINTINNSKEKSQTIALTNIKTTARIYATENPDEVIWTASGEQSYSCIKIKTLIDKNLLKQSIVEDSNKITSNNYIVITKDTSGNIISEQLDSTGSSSTCKPNENMVDIPTKAICNNSAGYTGEFQYLINPNIDNFDNLIFPDYQNTESKVPEEKLAGNYTIKIKPKNDYTWTDGTEKEIEITCTIPKAKPRLTIDPTGETFENFTVGNPIETTLTSLDTTGKIKIKSSNSDYVTAKPLDGNNNIEKDVKKSITIQLLSTRKTNTIITITLIPDDTKNYYTSTTTFTIGKTTKTEVKKPTAENYCKSIFYTGTNQPLTEKPGEGYTFINNEATNIGKYTITAKLKFGYVWKNSDNSTSDHTFICEIKDPTVTITYNSNTGNSCNPTTKNVTYNQSYGNLCVPTKENSMFIGWFTEKENGTQITKDSTVTNFSAHTLYAHWKTVSCSINYTGTLGNNNWYKTIGNVELKTTNYDSDDIQEIGLTTNSSKTFNNKTTMTQGETTSTTWYGYVKDINGNVITCKKTLKIDSSSPSCTSTGGNANWTTESRTLTGNCTDPGSGCVQNITKVFDTDINTTTASAGKVEDNAGNTVSCSADQTVKIDKTKPTTPTIVNPSNGQLSTTAFSLTVSSSDSGSGIAYWQYKYDSSTSWKTYTNSATDTFVTTKFSAERNENVSIRACDNAGNCSDISQTKIYIDYPSSWDEEGSCKFYLENGTRVTGWKDIGSKRYYFNSSGCMQTGWLQDTTDSTCTSGWWYLDPTDGYMVTGWKQVGSKWYYLAKEDGKEDKWQSTKPKGCMMTGWVYSEDYTCATHGWYFDSSGAMLYSTTVDGYTLNSSGCWVKKSVSIVNNNYYVCPEDQLVPTREKCATGQYNTMYVNNVSVSGTTVSVNIKLHMNNTSVTYSGSNNKRYLCLANSSNTCKIILKEFTISSGWTSVGANPINQTFSFNVSSLAAGEYRIIVGDASNYGGSVTNETQAQRFRFRDTPYAYTTIKITG